MGRWVSGRWSVGRWSVDLIKLVILENLPPKRCKKNAGGKVIKEKLKYYGQTFYKSQAKIKTFCESKFLVLMKKF